MTDTYPLFVTAATLFFSGLVAMSTARNLVKTIMSFQVALFGVNLALFTAGLSSQGPTHFATSLVVFSIVLGASIEAVALSFVILLYRRYHTLNPWKMTRLNEQ